MEEKEKKECDLKYTDVDICKLKQACFFFGAIFGFLVGFFICSMVMLNYT